MLGWLSVFRAQNGCIAYCRNAKIKALRFSRRARWRGVRAVHRILIKLPGISFTTEENEGKPQ